MYPDNHWYGHRSVLCRYCGLKDQKIFGSIQHGWFKPDVDHSSRRFQFLIPYFSWNSNFFKKDKNNKIITIGSPFLYLNKLLKRKIKSNGVLFFPAHNFPKSEQKYHKEKIHYVNFDHQDYIKKITKIVKGPYTVAIYYSDFSDKIKQLYEKKGWKVEITGNRQDPKSLDKTYKLIAKSKYVLCSEPGTSILYALFMGKKTRIIFNKNKYKNTNYYKHNIYFQNQSTKINSELYKKFIYGAKAVKFAKDELGYSHIKSRKELKKILGLDSLLKRLLSFIIAKMINIKYLKLRLSS